MDICEYNDLGIKVAMWSLMLGSNSMALYYGGNDPYIVALLTTPVQPGLINTPNDGDSAYIVAVNGSYTINSRNYVGVVTSRHLCDTGTYYPRFDNLYYMNNEFGFIKLDINRGTHRILELERSRIIRQ